MEIRQLKYFIAAAKYLNFTKAAKECNIVQTAMTQQIANLEQELKVKLFDRNRRALSLTAAGKKFLKDAKKIVTEVKLSSEGMEDFKEGYENVIRIGFHGEMFKKDLTEILKEFRRTNPRTKVYLFQEPQRELLEGLEYGELDLIFTIYGSFFQSLAWMETEILDENRLKLVVSEEHPLLAKEKVTWADLQEEPMIDFEEQNLSERELLWFQEGRTFKHYCLVSDHTSGEILIESGYGVSFWVERICDPNRYPHLRFIDVEGFDDIAKTCAAYRKEGLNVLCRVLIDRIREYEKKKRASKTAIAVHGNACLSKWSFDIAKP